MNNPNRNSYGAPRLLYRVDSRPPEVIFRDGFVAWGSNTDFFRHILGVIHNPNIPYHLRSIYVSTTDSPDSALRFFSARFSTRYHVRQPENPHVMYLYEIRADETFYSALVTGNRCLEVLRQNMNRLSRESLDLGWSALRALFGDFAYQREWMHVGNIPSRNIRSVHRVEAVPVDPRYAKYNRHTYNIPLYATVRIDDEEYLNPNYVDGFTYANHLPLDIVVSPETTIVDPTSTKGPTTVNIEENKGPFPTPPSGGELEKASMEALANTSTAVVGVDGPIAEISMGFACPSASLSSVVPMSSLPRRERNITDFGYLPHLIRNYQYSFLPLNELNVEEKYIYSKDNTEIATDKMWFKTKDKRNYVMSMAAAYNNYYASVIEPKEGQELGLDLFYDSHQRITCQFNGINYPISLTVDYSSEISEKTYSLKFETSSINDDAQKWVFEHINSNPYDNEIWYVIRSVENENMVVHMDVVNHELVLKEKFSAHERFEMLYFIVSKQASNAILVTPQRSLTNLIDLGLLWKDEKTQKTYNLDTTQNKFVYTSRFIKYKFFYDLETFEILDLEDKLKNYILYNNSHLNPFFPVRWLDIDKNPSRNYDSFKWYLRNKDIEKWKNYSHKEIVSFVNNNPLRVSLDSKDYGKVFMYNTSDVPPNTTDLYFSKNNLF